MLLLLNPVVFPYKSPKVNFAPVSQPKASVMKGAISVSSLNLITSDNYTAESPTEGLINIISANSQIEPKFAESDNRENRFTTFFGMKNNSKQKSIADHYQFSVIMFIVYLFQMCF